MVIVALVVVAMLIAPILGDQLAAFIDKLPGYVARLQSLVSDPSRPWLAKMFGDRLPDAGKSLGDLVTQGSGWLADIPALAVVGRPGADLDPLAARHHAGGRVLSAVRLGRA